MASPNLMDIRTRLATATADSSKALTEASQIGWLLINDELRGPFTAASLSEMKERLQVLRHALSDLEQVHAELRGADSRRTSPSFEVDGASAAAGDQAPVRTGPCRQCLRTDALVSVRVCMRCTHARRAEHQRWTSGGMRGPQTGGA